MDTRGPGLPLAETDVLVVDCQATAAAPRGHLLEIGWARAGTTVTRPHACLVLMPDDARIPPAVTRITGITNRAMRTDGVDARVAWQALADAAAALPQPAPTIVHFARFEQPFLCRLAGSLPPFDLVCTHEIARRLLPDLPRCGLRALAGYFGRSVGLLRRSADHVDATAFVWRQLVELLAAESVTTWSDMKAWLARPVAPRARSRRRVWPMPRAVRLALPDSPGVYRMLRTNGDVLYVGKASSLHHRVNSYFRHQRGVPERMLEMLSQARGISFEVTPSALEAALVEPDEIKRCRPPYNIALTDGERRVWFATANLNERSPRPSPRYPVGPFPSGEMLDEFADLTRASRAALGRGAWAPEATIFNEGYARLCAAHVELSASHASMPASLLRLGTRLWREGRRDPTDDDDGTAGRDRRGASWTPESVQTFLEWIAIRTALARRRARWFTRLADASIVWREPAAAQSRLLVLENGEVSVRAACAAEIEPPVPPGHRRSLAERHDAFTVARLDRLRVLTTVLKRLSAAGAPVAVRFGPASPIAGDRLASLVAWL